jgi:hypothetical protein
MKMFVWETLFVRKAILVFYVKNVIFKMIIEEMAIILVASVLTLQFLL